MSVHYFSSIIEKLTRSAANHMRRIRPLQVDLWVERCVIVWRP